MFASTSWRNTALQGCATETSSKICKEVCWNGCKEWDCQPFAFALRWLDPAQEILWQKELGKSRKMGERRQRLTASKITCTSVWEFNCRRDIQETAPVRFATTHCLNLLQSFELTRHCQSVLSKDEVVELLPLRAIQTCCYCCKLCWAGFFILHMEFFVIMGTLSHTEWLVKHFWTASSLYWLCTLSQMVSELNKNWLMLQLNHSLVNLHLQLRAQSGEWRMENGEWKMEIGEWIFVFLFVLFPLLTLTI